MTPGIQTRGRGRITTNKINQQKTQNKVVVAQPQSTSKVTLAQTQSPVTKYNEPLPTGSKLEQSTQNHIRSTASNIDKAKIIENTKYKDMNEIERFVHGTVNQVTDYQGIVNWDHKSESVLNQSLERVFEGDLEGAGKLIQDNPYRFAGNLAVEVGSALIPATWGVKAAKYGVQAAKAASKAKQAKRAQETLNTLPIVKKTPKNYVYAKPDSGGDYIRVTDVENPHQISDILTKENSVVLEKFNFVKQASTDTGENVISIIPKKYLGTSNNEIFDKTTQGVMGFIQPPGRLSKLSTSLGFKPKILSESESLIVLKGVRTEIKAKKRVDLRTNTLLKRNEMRQPSMTGYDDTPQWRRTILINQIKEKFGFGAPVFRFAEAPGAKAHVSILEQNTINFSKFSSGTTPEDAVNTLVHESIHNALRAAGPGTLKSNKSFVKTSRMQSELDSISYMSDKSNQKKLVSALNKENYTMDELKKMSPDKLDLLIREQEALGNTNKFSTGKTINWKKSNAPEIRRTSKHVGQSHLRGIDNVSQVSLGDIKYSKLSPEANYKVMTGYPNSPFKGQFTYAKPIKQGKVKTGASLVDTINRDKHISTEKLSTDWFGAIKDSSPAWGTTVGKGYQYYNQVQKNRYQKNKINKQSIGGYGQFL